ncbi:uncharacterized protein troap isoform X1 [Xiphophorus hellerii]|uniref:uncharacterized protein troap isoform X1 n=1 Tax=Xiphophorus hellerii TaxID=8084 RepID=UPI0013B42B6C|nr:uncharacterized protein LOC116728035 isoform X1 [Xiphophorus hellerii]XP_032431672.1 uncharacterized protein LOC116728035 isoform X1 [Xiphophorus hellerii]
MSSSPVLRQQSQNKIRSDFLRMKSEHNIQQPEPKLSEVMSSLHLSKKGAENKDPIEAGRKPPLQPGGSRLPVLAKSLKLQAPLLFKESHSKWEEKPLAGKTKRKACTRPVPFNFSQRRTTRRGTENSEPLTAPQSRTRGNRPEHSSFKTPSKHQDLVKNSGKSLGKAVVNATHISSQPSPKLKTLAHLKNPTSTSGKIANQNVSITSDQAHLHPEVSLDVPKTSAVHQSVSLTTQASCSNPLNEKSENCQPGHAVLLNILRDEGVFRASQAVVTPKHSKQYNYLPQRVSVKKTQQKEGTFAGPVRSVGFLPDATALRSILQNEGMKDAMSRNSVCPPGRGTSIYSAQRVPVKKSCPNSTSCTMAAVFKETAKTKWSPQRVCNTKHQPMSAMKWYLSPCGTVGHASYKRNIHPRQEEVVQKLFDDPEDDQITAGTDNNPSAKSEQISVPSSSNKPPTEEKAETGRRNRDDDDEDVEKMKTFLHAPPRESVIFFSTGKKLMRAPRFENQEASAQRDQVLSEQKKFTTAQSDVSEPTQQSSSVVQRLRSDFVNQKPCSLNPAVAMLRKRFPPLEELRMDEEVATYTSVSVPGASEFVHSRCGNPLASVLHFEESMRFVPIDSQHEG